MRQLLGLVVGVLAGGVLGYYHVVCPGGTCPLTGTWLGGAVLGGLIGVLLAGGCPACRSARPKDADPPAEPDHKAP